MIERTALEDWQSQRGSASFRVLVSPYSPPAISVGTNERGPNVKAELHPDYHPVLFIDGEHEIVTRSTMTSNEKRELNGVEHYVVRVDISSYTHPFYTGKQRLVDTAGRVERFRQRYAKNKK